jgi:Zn-dependent metalloprotease
MSDIEIHQKESIEISAEQQKRYRYIGSVKYKKGMNLFQYNTKTQRIDIVNVKVEVMVGLDKKVVKKRTVNIDPDCIFVQALNIKNAHRKIVEVLRDHIDGKTDKNKVNRLIAPR